MRAPSAAAGCRSWLFCVSPTLCFLASLPFPAFSELPRAHYRVWWGSNHGRGNSEERKKRGEILYPREDAVDAPESSQEVWHGNGPVHDLPHGACDCDHDLQRSEEHEYVATRVQFCRVPARVEEAAVGNGYREDDGGEKCQEASRGGESRG